MEWFGREKWPKWSLLILVGCCLLLSQDSWYFWEGWITDPFLLFLHFTVKRAEFKLLKWCSRSWSALRTYSKALASSHLPVSLPDLSALFPMAFCNHKCQDLAWTRAIFYLPTKKGREKKSGTEKNIYQPPSQGPSTPAFSTFLDSGYLTVSWRLHEEDCPSARSCHQAH